MHHKSVTFLKNNEAVEILITVSQREEQKRHRKTVGGKEKNIEEVMYFCYFNNLPIRYRCKGPCDKETMSGPLQALRFLCLILPAFPSLLSTTFQPIKFVL